ncbi:SpoIIE family protein phosphatase [Phytohabitans sp. LJ34]|uniref:SpoIIE family protein phosphatase n=1 Tax=Phytohabitans sp. LJ34 TaxID=3452217 RepID=UPI003F8C5765
MRPAADARARWAPVWIVTVVAAGYGLGSGCAWLLFRASDVGAVFFPPAGVTLGALLLARRRHWVWVLGAAGAVELAVNLWQRLPPGAACGFVLTNTLEPLVGAALVRRFRPGPIDLTRVRDAAVFLVCAVGLGPLAGALVGATTSAWTSGAGWWTALGQFWAGDGLAVLTLGSAVVGLATLRARPRLRRLWRAALMLAATAALTAIGFWPRDVPLIYLPVPLLLAAAFGGRVATVGAAGFVMAFVANLQSAAGRGPWAVLADQPDLEAATLQVYLAFVVVGAWVLAIAVAERDRARAQSRREEQARRRLETLQAVTAGLAGAATGEQVVRVLVEKGVAVVADHGYVTLLDRDGVHLRIWPTSTVPRTVVARFAEVRLGDIRRLPVVDVVREGRPVVLASQAEIAERYPAIMEVNAEVATRSLLVVPVRVAERTLGALAFAFHRDAAVGPEVAALAQSIADLAGQAVDRAERYEAEYSAAHELQRSLLPRISGHLPGVRAWAAYHPAERGNDVGGDWYDVFELPGSKVAIAVGDVVGHGLGAAAAMGRLQQVLRSTALAGASPAEVLESLDAASLAIDGAAYTTVGYAEYDPIDQTLTYATAGHLPPLLATGDGARYLDGGRSQPLQLANRPRAEATIAVPEGAMLVWYSDGLLERRHEIIDVGLDRLARTAETLRDADPQAWCDRVVTAMTEGSATTDDVVVMCLLLGGITAPADVAGVLRLTLHSVRDLPTTRRALRTWSAAHDLSADQTDALLMTANEALINSLEHAYHGRPVGPVTLTAARGERREIRVEVDDRGRWRPSSTDGERGRGLDLINQMARRVVVNLSRHGTRVTITVPES